MVSEPWKARVRVFATVPTPATHLVVGLHPGHPTFIFGILWAIRSPRLLKIFFDDFSISGLRAHHQVCRDLIYPSGGTPTSTSDRCDSMHRSSLRRPPPLTGACGCMGHFSATCFHLQTRQPLTRPCMPPVLPFNTCRCEF